MHLKVFSKNVQLKGFCTRFTVVNDLMSHVRSQYRQQTQEDVAL